MHVTISLNIFEKLYACAVIYANTKTLTYELKINRNAKMSRCFVIGILNMCMNRTFARTNCSHG